MKIKSVAAVGAIGLGMGIAGFDRPPAPRRPTNAATAAHRTHPGEHHRAMFTSNGSSFAMSVSPQ